MSTPIPLDAQRSVARPPTRLNLPLELVDLIIGHVCADDIIDRGGLKRLSLFSKCFTPACQRVLFKAVTLQPAKFVLDNQEQIGPDTGCRFATLIHASPHLAAFVKRLVYRFPRGPRKERTDIGNPNLASTLSKLVNVTELHLEASEGDKSPFDVRRQVGWVIVLESKSRRAEGGIDALLLGIMQRPTTKKLRIRNIQISVEHMMKCCGIEHLELHHTLITGPEDYDWRSNKKVTEGAPVYLKRLSYQGGYELNDDRINSPGNEDRKTDYLNVQWNLLETLSLPIQPRYWSYSHLPEGIMSATRCLRELHIYTMKPLHPGENDGEGTIPHLSPIRGLHPDSCLALTRLRFDIGFNMEYGGDDEQINDPYHGLLLDGWFAKLINLEELEIRVLIGGRGWMDTVIGSFGSQWAELDKAAVPQGKESPYRNLRKVEIRVGIDGVYDEATDQYYRPDMQRMLDTNFDGLRRLEREGQIRLVLEVANRIDEEGWRRQEERKRKERIEREKWSKEVKEEQSDSELDNSDEDDEDDEGEEVESPEEDKE